MGRRLTVLFTMLAMLASGAVAASTLSPTPAHAQQVGGFDFSRPEVIATGLDIPWGLAFLPGGDALVVERASAQVIWVGPGNQQRVLGRIPNVSAAGEGGLLGLAVSPTYPRDGWIYAYHTSPTDNRIVRFQLSRPQNAQPILTGIPRGTQIHNGGRIAFGPDGMLYAATGDAGTTAYAQDRNSLAGKILRMTPDGDVPKDNPFGNLVYSLGHRNVQGLAWDRRGRLFASEFGATSTDEVNLILPGRNYGWPICEGVCNDPRFEDPVYTWRTADASPSGAAIARDTLFVAALRGQRLWTLPVTASGVGPATDVLHNRYGRLRTVEVAPDGSLWVTTSNRDGRGNPTRLDDQVLRFPPIKTPPTKTPPPPSSPPPSSSPPPVSPSPSSPPPAGGCVANYTVVNDWISGFQVDITVTNLSSQPSQGWEVAWEFPSGQTILALWNGQYTQTGDQVVVTNVAWNGAIPPGASMSFGFHAASSGTNDPPPSLTCTLR